MCGCINTQLAGTARDSGCSLRDFPGEPGEERGAACPRITRTEWGPPVSTPDSTGPE